ncbi:unnamed protein product, partial [marine sediment metagenome]
TQISEANGNVILEKARNLALEDKYEDSLKLYNEAYNLFKHLEYKYECKQILWQINEIKDYQRMAEFRKSKGVPINLKDIVALASAERRRQRIQQGLGAKTRPVEIDEYKYKKRNDSNLTRPKGHKLLEQMKLSEKRNEKLKNTSQSNVKELDKIARYIYDKQIEMISNDIKEFMHNLNQQQLEYDQDSIFVITGLSAEFLIKEVLIRLGYGNIKSFEQITGIPDQISSSAYAVAGAFYFQL